MLATRTSAITARAPAAGVEKSVAVAAVRQVGTINFRAMLEIDLTVLPDDRPPYPATARQTVAQTHLALLTPGRMLTARVDPRNPGEAWIDLQAIR